MNIEWIGPLTSGTGYSTASIAYVQALRQIGGCGIRPISINNKYEHMWMEDDSKKVLKNPVRLFHNVPTVMKDIPSDKRNFDVIMTYFEMDRAPLEWKHYMKDAKTVVTCSKYSADSLSTVYPRGNIHVVPLGVGAEFTPQGKRHVMLHNGRELPSFKFLYVFEWVERKRPWDLLRAFREEFKPDEDACLILRTYSSSSAIKYEINKWALGSKVFLIDKKVEDMPSLYRSVDCYVSSAACEGWGEPLSEAMACGLPTIAGENGGNLEFMDYTNSFLVKTVGWKPIETNTMESVIKPWFMYKPVSVKSLKETMRYVYDNPSEAKKYGKKAADDMYYFSWVSSASKLLKILEGVKEAKV